MESFLYSILKPFVLILALIFGCIQIKAQDSTSRKSHFFWVDFGAGESSINELTGPGYEVSFSYQWKNNVISLRKFRDYENQVQESFSFGITNFDQPRLNLEEYSILFGKCYKKGSLYTSFSLGISILKFDERGQYLYTDTIKLSNWWTGSVYNAEGDRHFEHLKKTAIGFPVQGEIFWNGRFIGIGTKIFANLNTNKSNWGVLFSVRMGLLRGRLNRSKGR